MSAETISIFLQTFNETLTAAIVVIATSLVLYNLSKNFQNRVVRTSGAVLACITWVYACDVFTTLSPEAQYYEAALRLQWLGIAFLPATMFHLSDALLETTGLPSRGRRRRMIRVLYLISAIFFVLALATDQIIIPTISTVGISLQGGDLFGVYLLYFVIVLAVSFINLNRARQRCLTVGTQRRMAYLQLAILTPAIGMFPYSVVLNPGDEFSVFGLVLVNLANIVVILMLLFLSYPLSFFGSNKPDRVIKKELLRMLLYGPGTALLVLVIINFTASATRILSLPAEVFLPFPVVAAILLWQWFISLALPWFDQKLIYGDEDIHEVNRIQELSTQLISRSDLKQLLQAELEAFCDFLRVSNAFVTMTDIESGKQELFQTVGNQDLIALQLKQAQHDFSTVDNPNSDSMSVDSADWLLSIHDALAWESYAVFPLYSQRNGHANDSRPIGHLGIEVPSNDAEELASMGEESILPYISRTEQTLDNVVLQSEIKDALDGILPKSQQSLEQLQTFEFSPADTVAANEEHPLFNDVRSALRHYWGGTGIADNNLTTLQVVQQELTNTDTPINGLRTVIQEGIERQRPDGERQMTSPEWTIYNILQMRFIENKKVRDVARLLAISESDLYRKQRVAINTLAQTLQAMEQAVSEQTETA